MWKFQPNERSSLSFQAPRRRSQVRRMLLESLECRHLMAADLQYTLQPPAGVDVSEVGRASVAANDTYHVVGREYRGYQPLSSYVGEVHVYDANNGNLLRTIPNPEPELWYHFGESVDVFGDLLVVGTTGDGPDPELEDPGDFSDPTGKAYLYNLSTGALLHTFDKSYAPDVQFDPDLDKFGASVAIFGDFIAVGAPGKAPDDTADENDGHVFVFSASTGSLLYTLENPGPYDGGDFGLYLSLYDTKLVVSDPKHSSNLFGEGSGIVYVYDVTNGQLESTLTRPVDLELSLFGEGVDIYENTVVVGNLVGNQIFSASGFITFDATTGDVKQKVITDINNGGSEQLFLPTIWENTVAARFFSYQASDLNRPAARTFNATTGELLDTITTPNATPLLTSGFVTIYQDRLLVSQYTPNVPSEHTDVHVYSLDIVVGNPPTDLQLNGNTVVEHSIAGTIIGTLSATDPDIGDTFTYSLIDSAGGRFTISGSNLVVDQSALVNFETNPSPSVTVMVTDSTGKTYSESFVVQITNINDSPTDITLSNNQVVENATNNIPIGSLQGVDEDAGETFSYSLLNNAGGRFGLVGSILVVADGSLLDYEQNTLHGILVQVTDSSSNTFSRSLFIQVVNVSDSAPTDIILTNNRVVENAKNGTIVASFESSNPDNNGFGQVLASGGDFLLASESFSPNGGRVLMLDAEDGSVIRTFTNPSPDAENQFGFSIAATSQYIVIGNPKNDDNGTNTGKVYVYNATTGLLLHELSAPANQNFQEFGREIEMDGDRIIIREFSNTGGNLVHVYSASTGQFQISFSAPNQSSPFFGSEFAIEGNLVAISDEAYEVNGSRAGRVHLFNATTGSLLQTFENPEPNNTPGSNQAFFGSTLELSAGRLVVGNPGQDQNGIDSGSIYVFNVLTGSLLHTLTTPNPGAAGALGFSLEVSGNRIASRQSYNDQNLVNSGRVHLFDLDTGSHIASFTESTPQPSSFFGGAMAFAGDHLYVGSLSLYGQIEVFRSQDGERRNDLLAVDPDSSDTFTFQLLDDAGGRFSLVDNHLVVANSFLLNYEQATSHSVVIQVTDSTGLTFQKTLSISLLDTPEFAPSDLLLTDRFVSENAPNGTRISLIDNPTPYPGESFGDSVQSAFSYLLASDSLDQTAANQSGSLHMINAADGDLIRTLQSPNPTVAESFGSSFDGGLFALVVGDPNEDYQGADSGRVYLFDAANGSLLSTLSHPTPGANDRFGSSVSIESPWVVVGAENDGRAFIFDGSSGTLLHELGNQTPGFGAEVLVTNTLAIIGSPLEGNGGRVYIYDVTTGNLVSVRDNPNPGSSGALTDLFGSSLALLGDKLLVGAPGEDLGSEDAGAAYLLNLLVPNSPIQTLVSPAPSANQQFGSKLSVDSLRLAVGAGEVPSQLHLFDVVSGNFLSTINADPGEVIGGFWLRDSQLYYSSRAQGPTALSQSIHVVDSFTFEPRSAFKPIDADQEDTFTYTLLDDAGGRFALQGDQIVVANGSLLNFDLAPSHTIVVQVTDSSGLSLTKSLTIQVRDVYEPSAPTDIDLSNFEVVESLSTVIQNPVTQSAFETFFGRQVSVDNDFVVSTFSSDNVAGSVFLFHKLSGELLHPLVNPSPSVGDRFGFSLQVSGDKALVGASSSDHVGLNNGEAYLYDAKTGDLLHTLLNPSPSASSDGFGSAVSMDGSLIAIANRISSSGRVELFNANTGLHSLTILGPDPNAEFGRSVVVQGDKILIGASGYDGGGSNIGRAYLYQYDSVNNIAILLQTFDNPAAANGEQFGLRVAMDGNLVAIAAPFDSAGLTFSGTVYLFNSINGNLLRVIDNPTPGVGDLFGEAIAIDGDRLLVGAFADSNLGISAGQTYVFDTNTGALISSLGSPNISDFYGDSIALDGNDHVISVPGDDTDGLNRGRVFVYHFESGSVIGSLSTVDANSSDTFTYSLTNSAGGRFAVRGNELIIANGTLLDYETNTTHQIEVQVTDSSGLSFTKTLTIELIDVLDSGIDYGDLPDTFGTTSASNGASHSIVAGYYLGNSNSPEPNGQPSSGANLDTSDNGVTLPSFLIPGLDASLEITASSIGRIDAFIDYSGDGVFTESERITPVDGEMVIAGTNTLYFDVPTTALPGNRAVRVRYSTEGRLGPTGPASSGEVEDYLINVSVPASLSSSLLADPANIGKTMLYVKGTAAADTIVVSPFGSGLIANINGNAGQVFNPSTRIVIFGLAGDDQIWINNTSFPGYIDGGNGNDVIRGGNGPDRIYGRSGNDFLYGRAGNDTLFGNSGNDSLFSNGGIGLLFGGSENDILEGNGILVGGAGADSLLGLGARNLIIGSQGADNITGANADQGDILIAGYTSYDENEKALIALRDEWKRTATIVSRIEHLNGAVPGGLNISKKLNATTVFKEFSADTITNFGGSTPDRNDWVFLSDGDTKTNPPGIVVFIGDPPAPIPPMPLIGSATNFAKSHDVNNDGKVSPLDALQVINFLNMNSGMSPNDLFTSDSYLDVNGDGKISPLDALQVINSLNQNGIEGSSGEGEGRGMDSGYEISELHDFALVGFLEEELQTNWKRRR